MSLRCWLSDYADPVYCRINTLSNLRGLLMILQNLQTPADLKKLSEPEIAALCAEIREKVIDAVKTHGGHLGSNLGAVELTVALHRTMDSPKDIILWDTGHQAYVHKMLTGRIDDFDSLRQEGGLSGYPSRQESDHDWIENSHASTALAYAHGLSVALGEGPERSTHHRSYRRWFAHRRHGL